VSGAEFVGIDACFGSEQAQKERFFRHFKTEYRDGLAKAQSDIFGDIERQRCFSHGGARREND